MSFFHIDDYPEEAEIVDAEVEPSEAGYVIDEYRARYLSLIGEKAFEVFHIGRRLSVARRSGRAAWLVYGNVWILVLAQKGQSKGRKIQLVDLGRGVDETLECWKDRLTTVLQPAVDCGGCVRVVVSPRVSYPRGKRMKRPRHGEFLGSTL